MYKSFFLIAMNENKGVFLLKREADEFTSSVFRSLHVYFLFINYLILRVNKCDILKSHTRTRAIKIFE